MKHKIYYRILKVLTGLTPTDSWYRGKTVNNIENQNSFVIVEVVLIYNKALISYEYEMKWNMRYKKTNS